MAKGVCRRLQAILINERMLQYPHSEQHDFWLVEWSDLLIIPKLCWEQVDVISAWVRFLKEMGTKLSIKNIAGNMTPASPLMGGTLPVVFLSETFASGIHNLN